MSSRPVAWCAAVALLAACSSGNTSDGPSTVAAPTTAGSIATTGAPTTAAPTTTTTVPGVFADAAAVAAELSAVEAGIRAEGATAAELDSLGRREQLAYRALARHDDWWPTVAELVDDVAAGPLAHHLAARQASIAHSAGKPPSAPATLLPAWTIVAPLPAAELRGYYAAAQAATGVPWQYLAAIHFQETRMGRVVGVSSAGAIGPMQFLPEVWAACCTGDPSDTQDAIMGAATFLVQHGAPADMQAALNAYNPNSAYVGAVTAYALNMIDDERAYLGYHGWQVFYGTAVGTVRLPVGYAATAEVDAATYVADHPDDVLPDT